MLKRAGEYELDSDLRDAEPLSLLEPSVIRAFFERVVLPHVSDAWQIEDSVKIGDEISFTRYLYKAQPLRI